jgi:hypothetical protein
MLERYLGELNVEDDNAKEQAVEDAEAVKPARPGGTTDSLAPKQEDWLSSIAGEGKPEEID